MQNQNQQPLLVTLARHAGLNYFKFPIIQSTAACTCSSVSAGLPPLAGIIPVLSY